MSQYPRWDGNGGLRSGAGPVAAEAAERSVLAFVLSGGNGERLRPLTEFRAKAAVPFGVRSRLIDFVLSNLANSGLGEIGVPARSDALSLLAHLRRRWGAGRTAASPKIAPLAARDGYRGTADAVFQNLELVRRPNLRAVLILGSDHV